jgi:UDP-sugar pyrophosphorylase
MSFKGISPEEEHIIELLKAAGQDHVINQIPNHSHAERQNLVKQVTRINSMYPGGISNYTQKAKKLLRDSLEGANPYEGWRPSVPLGQILNYKDSSPANLENLVKLEKTGLDELRFTAFVLGKTITF